MVFRHLEEKLDDKHIPEYFSLFENVQEPTKTVLGYVLDIAGHLDDQGLGNEYEIFGGYAVLSHLMDAYGPEVARLWRGSTDIDMAGTERTLNALRSGYNLNNDRESPNVRHKRTLKLTIDNEENCKIDFSMGDYVNKYGAGHINYHLGIPVEVISPEDIIRGKLYTPISEEQHLGDIVAMVSVLEKRGYTPEQVARIFIGNDRKKFMNRFRKGTKIFEKDRFGFFPSGGFVKELDNGLSDLIMS